VKTKKRLGQRTTPSRLSDGGEWVRYRKPERVLMDG